VNEGRIEPLEPLIRTFDPDSLAVHLPPGPRTMRCIASIGVPYVAWVHGAEVRPSIPGVYYNYIVRARDLLDFPRWSWELAQRVPCQVEIGRFLGGARHVFFTCEFLRRQARSRLLSPFPHSSVLFNPVDLNSFRFSPRASIEQGRQRPIDVDPQVRTGRGDWRLRLPVPAMAHDCRSRETGGVAAAARDAHPKPYVLPHGERPARPGAAAVRSFRFLRRRLSAGRPGPRDVRGIASGLPVVATQVGGIPEIVRERMDRSALALAKEKYNWTRDEAALLDAYRQFGIPAGMGAR